jgi:hypothetical protein
MHIKGMCAFAFYTSPKPLKQTHFFDDSSRQAAGESQFWKGVFINCCVRQSW